MKLTRLSAVVAAAAIAPAALLTSLSAPAVAADAERPSGVSAPDTAPDTASSAEEDRVEILRILADSDTGRGVREAAQKALDGTAEDMRHFLEVGQHKARYTDDRVLTTQILSAGGPGVKEAALEALKKETPEAVREFIEVGQHKARYTDDRVLTTQILGTGGPAVKKAALEALKKETPEAVRHFIEVGQHEARAQDNTQAKAAKLKGIADEANKANKAKAKAKAKAAGGR
ncbi:ALF repeat-containing protein [Streptomyces katsurahamanus]|uniref:Chemotaxis protein n=1 Tax=Streptomyces katsurahamanus TaxID=2577098 RepID=A0ABW9P2T2_9ACTN|nr:ALF repeat-containing protein [Streptomyces katsurahamanus]MQS39686.1 chemotaxis protein [Streptomyces katsurahamanus]